MIRKTLPLFEVCTLKMLQLSERRDLFQAVSLVYIGKDAAWSVWAPESKGLEPIRMYFRKFRIVTLDKGRTCRRIQFNDKNIVGLTYYRKFTEVKIM